MNLAEKASDAASKAHHKATAKKAIAWAEASIERLNATVESAAKGYARVVPKKAPEKKRT